MTPVSTTLTTELLLHRAGTKSYWRGLTYRDSVQSLRVHSRHVAARVPRLLGVRAEAVRDT